MTHRSEKRPRGGDGRELVQSLILLVNTLFAGVGGLYAATESLAITLVAAVGVIVLTALMIINWRIRRPSP